MADWIASVINVLSTVIFVITYVTLHRQNTRLRRELTHWTRRLFTLEDQISGVDTRLREIE